MGEIEYDEQHRWMHTFRSVDEPCERCYGSGVVVYGSTATWRGGIGGQTMTSGPCDKCWGSGCALNPWTNLRDVEAQLRGLKEPR